jgi:eukaryotic-like serine/threonine-protein kinase
MTPDATLLMQTLEEQRAGWRRGERALVEMILKRQPLLSADREATLDLIYNEIMLREESGERPQLEEYRERFPHLAAALAVQFEVEHALDKQLAGSVADRGAATMRESPLPVDVNADHGLPTLPGYEILEVLGRGGAGVVYKARQLSLKRLVALKMILTGAHAGPEELTRFRTEAEAVARLQHPNIVQVFEVGAHEGRPFMAMELVEGNLSKILAGTPAPPRLAAQWVEELASAVQYAHQQGIVHRDLKPANILIAGNAPLSATGERPAVLKIADFGMAKIMVGDSVNQTQTGAILGTPNYMTPEQAAGKIHEIGPATDVYGLGAILYQLLTGRPPFPHVPIPESTPTAVRIARILEEVRLHEPTAPSRLQPKLPRDLETICLTCLQKEPGQRYASAAALAEDLRAYLAGEPIRSRPAGSWERLARWARRRPTEAARLAIGGMALVGLAVGIWWSNGVAAAAIAGIGLLAGSWWYNLRLQSAILDLTKQQMLTERSVERQRLLLEMTRRLLRTNDRTELLRLLADTAARLANAESATIYLLDRERGELWSTVTLDQKVGEIRLPLGVGIAGTVAVTGEPIAIPDAYADTRFNPEVDRRTGHVTRTLVTVPMTAQDGSILGVFQVINKRQGAFGIDDIEILSALAASASIAIDHTNQPQECRGTTAH